MNGRARSILSVHNHYQQPGGEDEVFAAEAALLEREGHSVIRYEERNARIDSAVATGLGAVWNHSSYLRLRGVARSNKPDVAHIHNVFPLISPAAYYALRSQAVPIVQSVHNFRLVCPGATLQRKGVVCQECLDRRSLLPALTHGCYRGSRSATGAVVAMLNVHRAAGTWQHMVDLYIAPSEFTRHKLVEGGLPPDRIVVKRYFVPDSETGDGQGRYALFVGRLVEEKGPQVLAEAWKSLPGVPLLVVGDGPLRDLSWPSGATPLGSRSRERMIELMKGAYVLIVPSIGYEPGPLTVLEAFASGLPVIASDLGSLGERVEHHRTGLLFRPGDPEDLAAKVRWAFDHPQELAAMRVAARREFEGKYTAERNYKMLMEIYDLAIENARGRRPAA